MNRLSAQLLDAPFWHTWLITKELIVHNLKLFTIGVGLLLLSLLLGNVQIVGMVAMLIGNLWAVLITIFSAKILQRHHDMQSMLQELRATTPSLLQQLHLTQAIRFLGAFMLFMMLLSALLYSVVSYNNHHPFLAPSSLNALLILFLFHLLSTLPVLSWRAIESQSFLGAIKALFGLFSFGSFSCCYTKRYLHYSFKSSMLFLAITFAYAAAILVIKLLFGPGAATLFIVIVLAPLQTLLAYLFGVMIIGSYESCTDEN